VGTRPGSYAQAFVQFRADQARSCAYKLRNSGIISDPQGGELPACEADLDMLLNDALARVPLDSTIRV
jgi:hypothetical protein